MTAIDLLHLIQRDAELTLLPSGRLKLTGADVERWLPVLAQYEQALVAELRATDLSSGLRADADKEERR